MKYMKNKLLFPYLYLLFLVVGCEDNDNVVSSVPETGTISGAITFSGTWADSGSVLLTLDTQYPPMGPPAGSKTITDSELANGIYGYSFESLAFGDYAAITVTYWPSGYSSGSTNYTLLGSYINTISVSVDVPELTINIDADF